MKGEINNNGLILMISLWILAIISLLCLGLAHRVIIDVKLAKLQKDKTRCFYIAKAAVQKAVNTLEKDLTKDIDSLGELWSRGIENEEYIFKDIKLGSGVFTASYIFDDSNIESPIYLYGMSDEDRKININKALQELLVSLFSLIAPEQNAEDLAKAILYWRGDIPESGESYYKTPEIPYSARKAPFKTIEELSLVQYFREDLELAAKCGRFLTAHTQEGLININTAEDDVLKAIFVSLGSEDVNVGFSDRLVVNIIDSRDGDDNQEATEDDTAITVEQIKNVLMQGIIDNNELGWINNNFINFSFTVKSNLFKIEALAKLNSSNAQNKVTAIADRAQQPPKIIYWHEE